MLSSAELDRLSEPNQLLLKLISYLILLSPANTCVNELSLAQYILVLMNLLSSAELYESCCSLFSPAEVYSK